MPVRGESSSIGAKLVRFDSTSSSIDEARKLAEQGTPHGTAVLADRQTAGRGRRGRTWYTLPGKSLAATVVLRDLPDQAHVGMAGMAGALAVLSAVDRLLGVRLETKWPNDVVRDGKKLAGTLAEVRQDALLLSIGLNVNGTESDLPPDIRRTATTLQMVTGRPVDRDELCRRVLEELGGLWRRLINAPQEIISWWESVDITNGALVRVDATGNRTIEGRAVGIDGSGQLRLAVSEGRIEMVAAGDVDLL